MVTIVPKTFGYLTSFRNACMRVLHDAARDAMLRYGSEGPGTDA